METASLFIQTVVVVLSGTMSHVIVSDARKAPYAKGSVRILIEEKSTQSSKEMS